jgi:hypothetical protein
MPVVPLILVNSAPCLRPKWSGTLRAPYPPMREVKRTMIARTLILAGIALR